VRPSGAPDPHGRVHSPGAPWSLRQTLVGTVATLLPWLAVALTLAAAPQNTASQPTHRLAPALDAASGILIFIISAAIEAVFLLAPLYYALRQEGPRSGRPGEPGEPGANLEPIGDQGAPRHDWPARIRLAGERLGLVGWTTTGDVAPDESARAPGAARRRWRMLWLTLALAAAGLAASALYSYIITLTHAPIATNSDALAQQAQTAPLTVLGSLLAAVLVAPICEEVFFRAFLFRGLLRGMPLWPAILLSSLLFALAHADLGSFIPLFIIGIALAYARWRARSLWPSVAIHALNNLVAGLLLAPILITALSK